MNASTKNDTSAENGEHRVDLTPIPLLETIRAHGRVWGDLAAQYGVTNPDPLGRSTWRRRATGFPPRPVRFLCLSGVRRKTSCPRRFTRMSLSRSDSFWRWRTR